MSFNEKKSYTEYNVTSSTSDFAIGFKEYGLPSDTIKVTVNNVDVDTAGYTVTRKNDLELTLIPPVVSGIVRLQRETNIDESFHVFTAGAKFVAANMDANFNQILHSQQETRDGFDKLKLDVYPLVDGLTEALAQADAASQAAQAAAQAAESAADLVKGTIRKVTYTVDLLTIPAVLDDIAFVSAYSSSVIGGGGYFQYYSTGVVDNVGTFAGVGGVWKRIQWKYPTVLDAGIIAGTDCTIQLQTLVNLSTNKIVNLLGYDLKVTALDLPSNTILYNGSIDTTSSTWANTYGRNAIMLSNTPRNAVGVDYEGSAAYVTIQRSENITFNNIQFKAGAKGAGVFFKVDGLKFLNCSGTWLDTSLFRIIGGWHGTVLTNDTPTSYTLDDPINGWCTGITISNCNWVGGYVAGSWCSPFRFVACQDIEWHGGYVDSTLGYHIDTYNRNVDITTKYLNSSKASVIDTINGTAAADLLALYVGQNCYGVSVHDTTWTDYANKGAYIECCSEVRLHNVFGKLTNSASVARFADVQPNYKDNTNTTWGNVANVHITGCTQLGGKYGVLCTPYQQRKSIRNLVLRDNTFRTTSTVECIALVGVENCDVQNNVFNGNLYLGANNQGGVIKGNTVRNNSNYALVLGDTATKNPQLISNDFEVITGSVILNNVGTSTQIRGGRIVSKDYSPLMVNGSTAGQVLAMDFDYGAENHFIITHTFSGVPNNGSSSFYLNNSKFKSGWGASITVLDGDVNGNLNAYIAVLNGSLYITLWNRTGATVSKSLDFAVTLYPYLDRTHLN